MCVCVFLQWSRLTPELLELEADDMFGSRQYRILALDHGTLSFRDLEVDQWPAILITNPKDARFIS